MQLPRPRHAILNRLGIFLGEWNRRHVGFDSIESDRVRDFAYHDHSQDAWVIQIRRLLSAIWCGD